jgi:hypothetical protein
MTMAGEDIPFKAPNQESDSTVSALKETRAKEDIINPNYISKLYYDAAGKLSHRHP